MKKNKRDWNRLQTLLDLRYQMLDLNHQHKLKIIMVLILTLVGTTFYIGERCVFVIKTNKLFSVI